MSTKENREQVLLRAALESRLEMLAEMLEEAVRELNCLMTEIKEGGEGDGYTP